MAIQNQGWAYVSGSGAGVPGGSNTQVQYNDAGDLQGSANFTFNGTTVEITGNLATSAFISSSTFYGDGSNLTGITASAVNVADGPEYAIQFRRDTPVSGEISGSSALMFLTASNTLSGIYAQFTAVTASSIVGGSPLMISSSATTISGNVLICNGTASISNLSGCSPIQVHAPMQMQQGLSLSFNGASDTAKITNNGSNLDINSPGSIVLNSGNNNVSSSANISGSSFVTANATYSTTGVTMDSDGGNLIIQNDDADKAVRVILGANNTGFSGFQVRTSTGAQVFGATDQGVISGSGALSAASFAADGTAVVGSLTAGDLTDNRLPLIGTSGLLQDSADFTYVDVRNPAQGGFVSIVVSSSASGSSLLSDGAFNVYDESSSLIFRAGRAAYGGVRSDVNVDCRSTLNVDGTSTMAAITADGVIDFSNTLNVDGTSTMAAITADGALNVSGASDVGLNVNSVFTGGASILSIGNVLAGHTGGGNHAAHMNSNGDISGSTIQGTSLSVDGTIICGTDITMRGAQQISFGTKLTGYANTIASPFYRVYPVDTAPLTGSTMIILPAISAATHGLELTIKDIGNNAATRVINVTGATGTGDKMDTSTAYKAITSNNGWSTIVAQSGSSGTHVWYQIAGKPW